MKPRNLPNHVHHEDDIEDNEEVVCVPEDLIMGHPKKKERERVQNDIIHDCLQRSRKFQGGNNEQNNRCT